jgi:hypothetical protein
MAADGWIVDRFRKPRGRSPLDHPWAVRGLVLLSGYFYPTARADVALASRPAIPVLGDVLRYTVSPLLGRALLPAVIKGMFTPREVPADFAEHFPPGMRYGPPRSARVPRTRPR